VTAAASASRCGEFVIRLHVPRMAPIIPSVL
jgi:hypothetical protein